MRKILSILFCLTPAISFAQLPMQDGAVTYTDVIKLDSTYTANMIYASAKEFIQTRPEMFNRSNSEKNQSMNDILWGVPKGKAENIDALFKNTSPLKLDVSNERLTARGVFKYTGRDALAVAIRLMYIEYNVNIYVKDGRFKLEITDFVYTHYNHKTMQQAQIWGWNDEGACASKGRLEFLFQCEKAKKDFDILYPTINAEMDSFHKSIVSFIGTKRKSKTDF